MTPRKHILFTVKHLTLVLVNIGSKDLKQGNKKSLTIAYLVSQTTSLLKMVSFGQSIPTQRVVDIEPLFEYPFIRSVILRLPESVRNAVLPPRYAEGC